MRANVPENPTISTAALLDHGAAAAAEADAERELTVCRKLRTKLAFSALHDASGAPLCWQRGDGSTAVYWCLRTMECAGPDGALVHAADCGPDRACYQPHE